MAKNKNKKKLNKKKSPEKKGKLVLKTKIKPRRVERKKKKQRSLSLNKKRPKEVILIRPSKKARPAPTIKMIKKKTRRVPLFDGIHRTKIRVIGIGGGGSAIVSEIASRVKKADFYIANTDSKALRKSVKGTKRFQFGQELTRGLGTGMNVELGESAALAGEEKIKKILEGQDLCIFIASLGGGTSSGASPVFAKISKNLGNITYGIFTLPFAFEGERKMEMAWQALERIKPHLNVYTIIPNERIFQIIDKNTPLSDALSAINRRLSDNLEGLIEMIYLPGLINIDFADLRTILAGRGRLTYLNTIEVQGPNKNEGVKKLISSPLYSYNTRGSRGILYNIISGRDIQLSEVYQISNIISESVSRKAKIIFGINQSPKYKDRIRITLLAVGCGAKGALAPSKDIRKPKTRQKKEKNKNLDKKRKKRLKRKKVPLPEKKPATAKKTKSRIEKIKKIKREKIKTEPSKTKKPAPILSASLSEETINPLPVVQLNELGSKVRKNALQVKKEAEEAEKEILEQEKIWEIPAILRRKKE